MLKFQRKLFSLYGQIKNKAIQIQQLQDAHQQADLMCDIFKDKQMLFFDESLYLSLYDMASKSQLFYMMLDNQEFADYVKNNANTYVDLPKLTGVQLLLIQMKMHKNQKDQNLLDLIENKVNNEFSDQNNILEIVNLCPDVLYWLTQIKDINPNLKNTIDQKLIEFYNNNKDLPIYSSHLLYLYFLNINQKDQVQQLRNYILSNFQDTQNIIDHFSIYQTFKLSSEECQNIQNKVVKILERNITVEQYCAVYTFFYPYLNRDYIKKFQKSFDNAFMFLNDYEKQYIIIKLSQMNYEDFSLNVIDYIKNVDVLNTEDYETRLRLYGIMNYFNIKHYQKEELYNQLINIENLKKLNPLQFEEILKVFLKIKLEQKEQKEILQIIRDYLETNPF